MRMMHRLGRSASPSAPGPTKLTAYGKSLNAQDIASLGKLEQTCIQERLSCSSGTADLSGPRAAGGDHGRSLLMFSISLLR